MAIYSEFSHYIKIVIFHSYVSLPEGMWNNGNHAPPKKTKGQKMV